MQSIIELTKEIESAGLQRTTIAYSNKHAALIQRASSIDGNRRIAVYDEYVRVNVILNLLVVIQSGPSKKPETFESFYGLPEQQKLL